MKNTTCKALAGAREAGLVAALSSKQQPRMRPQTTRAHNLAVIALAFQSASITKDAMAMETHEIETLIRAAFPAADWSPTCRGSNTVYDRGDHYRSFRARTVLQQQRVPR